ATSMNDTDAVSGSPSDCMVSAGTMLASSTVKKARLSMPGSAALSSSSNAVPRAIWIMSRMPNATRPAPTMATNRPGPMPAYCALRLREEDAYKQTAPTKMMERPSHQGWAGTDFIEPAPQDLLHKAGVDQNATDALIFGLDERAEFLAREKVGLPAQALHDGMPFLAFAQLGEAVDPLLVVVCRHVDGTQYPAPVGNFNVITGLFEGGDIGCALHAFRRSDGQDPDTTAIGKLLKLGNAGQTTLQRAVHDTGNGVRTARLWNVVQLGHRHLALLRQKRQCNVVNAAGRPAAHGHAARVGLERLDKIGQRLVRRIGLHGQHNVLCRESRHGLEFGEVDRRLVHDDRADGNRTEHGQRVGLAGLALKLGEADGATGPTPVGEADGTGIDTRLVHCLHGLTTRGIPAAAGIGRQHHAYLRLHGNASAEQR